jgi:magnesium transporter
MADFDSHIETADWNNGGYLEGEFFGVKTKRFHGLFALSASCAQIVNHPLLLALADFYPDLALQILWRLPETKRRQVFALLPAEKREQWNLNVDYPEESVGRLMDPPLGILRPDQTVAEAIATLRELTGRAMVTYGYVLDPGGRLLGVIVFRELLFADPSQRVEQVMLREPFSLRPRTPVLDAM